jgi:hypothetical protein
MSDFFDKTLRELNTIEDVKRALLHLKLKLSLMERNEEKNGTLRGTPGSGRNNNPAT